MSPARTASARAISAVAPLFCAIGVALGAYASHATAGPLMRERLGLAALFAFGHGLGLIALDRRTSLLARIARWLLVLGVVLFSGSLAGAALFGLPTLAAPFGGSLLIVGWIVVAIDTWRQPGA